MNRRTFAERSTAAMVVVSLPRPALPIPQYDGETLAEAIAQESILAGAKEAHE